MRIRHLVVACMCGSVLGFAPAQADVGVPTRIETNAFRTHVYLAYDGYLMAFNGDGNFVDATLTSGGAPVVGRTITFATSAGVLCAAKTNAGGRAWCSTNQVIRAGQVGDYTATFAGDDIYEAATASGTIGYSEVIVNDDLTCWINDGSQGLLGCNV
jgi:hypothetical protein